jgi:SulP family sulfate permease
MVNISSGARGRASSAVEGALALLAFLVLGPLVSWVPVAALAGLLIVIGARMVDRRSVHLLRSRSTLLDFAVIVAVVVTALTVSLIMASGVGIALAILLFLREQIGGSVVHHKALGMQMSSRRVRTPDELEILKEHGEQVAIFELRGSLFFGTADQLYAELEPELGRRTYVILGMRRLQTIDVTAAEMLRQVKDVLGRNGGMLLISEFPVAADGRRDVQRYLGEIGVVGKASTARVFGELDSALEWVEDRILEQVTLVYEVQRPMELAEIDLFDGMPAEVIAELETYVEPRSYRGGETIFSCGDTGDDLFLIRCGEVRINLPLDAGQRLHLATFGRGVFFGEMAFLLHDTRSADAVAYSDTDVFVLSRACFDAVAATHGLAASVLIEGVARALAVRLRYANAELRALR